MALAIPLYILTEKVFRHSNDRRVIPGALAIAFLAAYSFGANDVANAVGVYISVTSRFLGMPDADVMRLLAAFAVLFICLGGAVAGKKVVETLAYRVTRLGVLTSIAANADGIAVWLYTTIPYLLFGYGMPISTSYAAVGAVIGAGIAKDLNWILRAIKVFIKFEELNTKNLRLGIPNWYKVPADLRSLAPDIIDEVEDEFLNYVVSLGYNYVEVEMPEAVKYVWKYFSVIRYSEATATHMVNKDKWYLYSPDVRRLLEKGLEYKAIEYIEALNYREEVRRELSRILKKVNVLITPTTPIPAPKIDEVLGREDGPIRSLLTYETIFASYIGAPAISIPALRIIGLPVGIQLICNVGEDIKLLNIALLISKH